MKNVLILGASGQIAQWVIGTLASDAGVRQTLLLRNPAKLGDTPANARLVIGSVLDRKLLRQAMQGQDIVYANLTGSDLDRQAGDVIAAMQAAGVRRLVFVLSLGIHDEVPGRFGEWNRATIGEELKPFRRAAWLTDEDEVDYELTTRDQPFKGTVVSRRSVAALIVRLIASPELHVGDSLGVNKPGSDGDKPFFM